jgi:hypothetical protein
MDTETVLFFEGHQAALPLYKTLVQKLKKRVPDAEIRVQKTQISFYRKHLFGCVSFLPVRKQRPQCFLTLSFGLGYALQHSRVDQVAEPYPGRYTHHVMLTGEEDEDEQLMNWLAEAASFAACRE